MKKEQKEKLEAAKDHLTNDIGSLEVILHDWQDVFDERSERWQNSEKGDEWSDMMDDLDGAIDEMHDALITIERILNE